MSTELTVGSNYAKYSITAEDSLGEDLRISIEIHADPDIRLSEIEAIRRALIHATESIVQQLEYRVSLVTETDTKEMK